MANRLDEYFVAEAGEYLDQLQVLLSGTHVADPEGFLRLARGVRGSTKMAGSDRIADLAGRLEDAARSIGQPDVDWGDGVLDAARSTVMEIQDLVGSLSHWGPAEDERVQRWLETWNRILSPGAAAGPDVVPIESLFFDDEGPHILDPAGPAEPAAISVVPIESLLLRGESAIRHAISLRPSFDAAVRNGSGNASLAGLVEELFDLLDLSLTADLPEA